MSRTYRPVLSIISIISLALSATLVFLLLFLYQDKPAINVHAYIEDFPDKTLNVSRWTPAEWNSSSDGETLFTSTKRNLRTSGGFLQLTIAPKLANQASRWNFTGAKLTSTDSFRGGNFSIRARFTRGWGLYSTISLEQNLRRLSAIGVHNACSAEGSLQSN